MNEKEKKEAAQPEQAAAPDTNAAQPEAKPEEKEAAGNVKGDKKEKHHREAALQAKLEASEKKKDLSSIRDKK